MKHLFSKSRILKSLQDKDKGYEDPKKTKARDSIDTAETAGRFSETRGSRD